MSNSIQKDAEAIEALGGPAKVARMLGFDPKNGTQRVQNWKSRGIPVGIKYRYPHIFGDQKQQAAA